MSGRTTTQSRRSNLVSIISPRTGEMRVGACVVFAASTSILRFWPPPDIGRLDYRREFPVPNQASAHISDRALKFGRGIRIAQVRYQIEEWPFPAGCSARDVAYTVYAHPCHDLCGTSTSVETKLEHVRIPAQVRHSNSRVLDCKPANCCNAIQPDTTQILLVHRLLAHPMALQNVDPICDLRSTSTRGIESATWGAQSRYRPLLVLSLLAAVITPFKPAKTPQSLVLLSPRFIAIHLQYTLVWTSIQGRRGPMPIRPLFSKVPMFQSFEGPLTQRLRLVSAIAWYSY